MPAVAVPDILNLPAITAPRPDTSARPVVALVASHPSVDGDGVQLRRVFPSTGDMRGTDPFLLLDHLGAVEYSPYEAPGFPEHPHRGFETVTYMLDGEIEHRDSLGGGGLIKGGDTQWMTAGAGIVHSEMPSEELFRSGGVFHGFQLWVNLPAAQKFAPPRYQDLGGDRLTLLRSPDGGALIRVIAGEVGAHRGPGQTQTPIVFLHASVEPGALLEVPWRQDFNALVYVLAGSGTIGRDSTTSIEEGTLAVLGAGEVVALRADAAQSQAAPSLEALLIGGLPISEPIAHYGPFVMNTRAELVQAIDDYRSGRMGRIPPARA